MDVHDTSNSIPQAVDQPMPPTRDEVYYFQTVVFRVGNTLFRVPKIAINVPGTVFEAMFALPPTPDAEGLSDENPIVLTVDEDHFRGFLRVLLRLRGQTVTGEDWLDALFLATMWTFDDIRQEAIQALDGWIKSQNLKQVILTAKKYNIATWLKAAYTQLVMDSVWLSTQSFDELTDHPAVDWETVARLLHVRELHANASAGWLQCLQCGSGRICCGIVEPLVEETFKAEFERMKKTNVEEPPLSMFGGNLVSKKKKRN